MSGLITAPVAPATPNVSDLIPLSGGYTLASGQTRYSTALSTMFQAADFEPNAYNYVLNNAGTIWAENAAGVQTFGVMNWGAINNSGLIVAHSATGSAAAMSVTSTFRGPLNNSGAIYALADAGAAYAWQDWQDGVINNDGIIAARGATSARAISRANGGSVINGISGQILAEGPGALGVALWRGTFQVDGQPPRATDLLNYGRIEARSTDGAKPSVAVYTAHMANESMVIDNYGSITGDYAIYSSSSYFSPPAKATESVTNHSGGTINGTVFLDLGDDRIDNAGTMIGYVDLGEGNDTFDNRQGTHVGTADLGFGDDSYWGGAGLDAVAGGRGNDRIFGGGGDDLLLGGFGDDILVGEGGNDALYGESGNDRIVAQDGDLIDAGAGDDRIELGDYRFARVDGGTGYDTLVLPADARILDLSQAALSNRITGIEELLLAANAHLIVRPADVGALSGGGTTLTLSRVGAAAVDLTGGWVFAGTQSRGGVDYQLYSAAGVQVRVQSGATINLGVPPQTGSGLDAVATGGTPPAPGSVPGADLASLQTVVNGFTLNSDLVIDSSEHWRSTDGYAVLTSQDPSLSLRNYGDIQSSGGRDGARVIVGYNYLNLENYGTVAGSATAGTADLASNRSTLATYRIYNMSQNGSGNAYGVKLGGQAWTFVNGGSITASTDQAIAVAYSTFGRPGENRGTIAASSSDFVAVGAFAYNGGLLRNSGTISGSGSWGAYGLAASTHPLDLWNSGSITAHASGAGREGVALYLYYSTGAHAVHNSGTISGEIAIQTDAMVNGGGLALDNRGQITGRIELNTGGGPARSDVVLNSGTIDGSIALGGSRDVYDGTLGVQHGAVSAQDGADVLIGTAGRDTLDGGAGDDVLVAQGGDTLTGGVGRDIFVFASVAPGQAPETIADFVSGTDRIDLRRLAPTAVSISGSTITAVTSSGTLTIQVNGAVALSDIVGQADLLDGTSGNDTLVGILGGATLRGGTGDDVLVGASGNDRLDGGSGGDLMVGGAGDDTYVVDSPDDIVVEGRDGGYDTIEVVGGSATMPDYVERLVGGGGTGNALDNVMTGSTDRDWLDGGAGNDTIDGGAGVDSIIGGAGADRLTGGTGADEFVDTLANFNGDTITDLAVGDTITITDAVRAGFTYSLNGSALVIGSTTITLTGGANLQFALDYIYGVTLKVTAIGPAPSHAAVHNDFNGDGRSDIFWRSNTGEMSDWLGQANGGFVPNDANAYTKVSTDWQVVGTGDFNGDGRADLLWRANGGQVSDWLARADGGFVPNDATALTTVSVAWKIAGTGDFDGDGRDDILWRADNGPISDWLGRADGGFTVNDTQAFTRVDPSWKIVGTGDFNGDGRDDILWRAISGELSDWLGQAGGGFTPNDGNAFTRVSTEWHVVGTGDFNGDGRDDILWRSDRGELSDWLGQANGSFVPNDGHAFAAVPTNWSVAGTGDFNSDGRTDMLWREANGAMSDWLARSDGGFVPNDANALVQVGTSWQIHPHDTLLM